MGKRYTNHFTRKAKRMIFGEIDNIVWRGKEGDYRMVFRSKVYEEIRDEKIQEIWNREARRKTNEMKRELRLGEGKKVSDVTDVQIDAKWFGPAKAFGF